MPPLRIIHITPNGNIGGRERQVNLLLEELSKDKDTMENDLLFIRPVGPFYEESLKIPIQVFATDLKPYDPRYFLYMFKILRKYDIINFWGICYHLFFLSLLLYNTKTYTLTGSRFIKRKPLLDIIRGILANRIKPQNGARSQVLNFTLHLIPAGLMSNLGRFLRKKLFIFFLRKCSLIITPSNFLKSFAVDHYKLSPKDIRVIPNFLDFEKIVYTKNSIDVRQEFNVNSSSYLIGVVARFDTRKRLDRIVKTMSIIPAHYDVKAIIFGDGDRVERQKIENEIKQAKMDRRVFLPGFRMDIYNYIHALDMFVLPSEGEGFGIALVEALYLKIPSVVFDDGGGVLEIIKNGDTGFVVHTEQELSRLIQAQIVNRNGIKEIADRGYRNVVKNYSIANAGLYRESFTQVGIHLS